jgi:hypothetical protein
MPVDDLQRSEKRDLPPLLKVAASIEHLVWLRIDWLKETLSPDIGRLRRLRRVEIEGSWSLKRGPQTLPDELFGLPELEELECRDGRLTNLPEAIARAKKLVHLDVGGNEALASLPATFGELRRFATSTFNVPTRSTPRRAFRNSPSFPAFARSAFGTPRLRTSPNRSVVSARSNGSRSAAV